MTPQQVRVIRLRMRLRARWRAGLGHWHAPAVWGGRLVATARPIPRAQLDRLLRHIWAEFED